MTYDDTTASRGPLRRLALAPLLLALLLGGVVGLPAALAEMPPDVVAIVKAGPEDKKGRHLTFDRFCDAAGRLALSDIKRQRSGARAVLEQLIEELMVLSHCERLGINVTERDVKAKWDELDGQVRTRSGGTRTLRDAIKEQGTTPGEFREQLWHILRKEAIAAHPTYLGSKMPANEQAKIQQVGIVIATIRKKTDIKYGIVTVDHVQQKQRPANLGKNVVASVDGKPITMRDLGRALVLRLPAAKVREYLDRECKTALMTLQGISLSNEEFNAEMDHLEKLWPLERELKREEVWRTVSFKDRFETQFNMTRADAAKDRYVRGLLGLVRKMRSEVTEVEIQKEFAEGKQGFYGPHILADVIEVGFSQKKGFTVGGRSIVDARQMANGFARRLARGEAWEKVSTEINMRRDRTLRARTLRLTDTDQDRVHYDQAKRLRDGDVSTPYDTLAEICVMRRVGPRAARSLEEIRPYLRELIARRKTREWIGDKIKDEAWVQLRWPLPQRQ